MKPAKTKLTVAQIAALAGTSIQLVARKRALGKSDRAIIAEAEQQAQQAAQKHPGVVVTDVVNGHANGHAANGQWSYAAAQAAKEGSLAELRQLELMEKRGELIPVSYVRTWASRFLVEGRDLLLAGPGELQDVLAAEDDPVKVNAILRRWVERIMERFFQTETLWGGGPPVDEAVLRERYDAAKLSLVKEKPRR